MRAVGGRGFTNRRQVSWTRAEFRELDSQTWNRNIWRSLQFLGFLVERPPTHSLQFAEPLSTQTRHQHRSGNPLQRLAFASAPIRESRNTDKSCGAGAEFRGPVRNTVDSSPISTTSSADEESAQDTCDVDRRENSKRSKR